jgi:hypothetical protein
VTKVRQEDKDRPEQHVQKTLRRTIVSRTFKSLIQT